MKIPNIDNETINNPSNTEKNKLVSLIKKLNTFLYEPGKQAVNKESSLYRENKQWVVTAVIVATAINKLDIHWKC